MSRFLDRAAGRLRGVNWRSVGTVVAVIVAAVFIAWLANSTRSLWFVTDEFDYLGPTDGSSWIEWIFRPHNEHTIVFTKVWFSLLYSLIGLHAYWLYALPMVLSHVAAAAAVWWILRRRTRTRTIALFGTLPVLVMAGAFGTLTWGGQFQYTAAVAAGLWCLALVFDDAVDRRPLWLYVLLAVFGTLSGSAFMPLGIVAGFALLLRRRYVAGAVVAGAPIAWFVLVRLIWTVHSDLVAKSVQQVLRDGPSFVYDIIERAVDDTVRIPGFAAPLTVALLLAALWMVRRRPADDSERRFRLVLLLLFAALALSLFIAMVGRLSRDPASSAGGGYSYFVLVFAIPIAVLLADRLLGGRRFTELVGIVALVGVTATSWAALSAYTQSFAEWKQSNRAAVEGSAFLATQTDFPVVGGDTFPADAAPTFSWNDIREAAKTGKLDSVEPQGELLESISLRVQWAAVPFTTPLGDCEPLVDGVVTDVSAGAGIRVSAGGATLELGYPNSDAVRDIVLLTEGQRELTSTAGRPATITLTAGKALLCEAP
jgi:hypothetical protein